MANTTPDSIYYPLGTDPVAPLHTVFATQATSVQTALLKRQRLTYTWANKAARDAQTGMVAGSEGYQVDTKINYRYDGSQWAPTDKYNVVWPSGPAMPQGGVATNAPPAGTQLIRRIQYVVALSNAAGAVGKVNFAEPFPNAVMHINIMTIRNAGVTPVIDSGNIDRTGFAPIWPNNGNANIQFTYEAIGW